MTKCGADRRSLGIPGVKFFTSSGLVVPSSVTDVNMVHLVIPPALKVVAMNILNASQVWMNDQGGTSGPYGSGATQTQQSLQRFRVGRL